MRAERQAAPRARHQRSPAQITLPWAAASSPPPKPRTVQNGGYACASSARGGSGASSAQRIAGGVTAPPLPAAVPVGSGPSSEGPVDLFRRG